MRFEDTDQSYRVRRAVTTVRFGSLLNGRTFQRPSKKHPHHQKEVWLKKDKNSAFDFDNQNAYNIDSEEQVYEVVLVSNHYDQNILKKGEQQ